MNGELRRKNPSFKVWSQGLSVIMVHLQMVVLVLHLSACPVVVDTIWHKSPGLCHYPLCPSLSSCSVSCRGPSVPSLLPLRLLSSKESLR